jgi:hypothetical protein
MTKQKIGFNGLAPKDVGGVFVEDGYAGLDWTNVVAIDERYYGEGSGYQSTTPYDVGLNAFAGMASFSAAENFRFVKGIFSGAWNDDLSVTIRGYDDGVLVGETTFTVDYDEQLLVKFGKLFKDVDTIEIRSAGGVDNPDGVGGGSHVSFDSLVIAWG